MKMTRRCGDKASLILDLAIQENKTFEIGERSVSYRGDSVKRIEQCWRLIAIFLKQGVHVPS